MAKVRPRLDSDLPASALLLADVYNHSGYPVQGATNAVGLLTEPLPNHAWVLEVDDLILGHVMIRDKAGQNSESPQWEVSKLFISPKAAGKGYGMMLLQETMNWAKERNLELTLFVLDKDKIAMKLYKKAGWVMTREDIYKWGEGSEMKSYYFAWKSTEKADDIPL